MQFTIPGQLSPSAADHPQTAMPSPEPSHGAPSGGDPSADFTLLKLLATIVGDLEKVRIANENRLRQLVRTGTDKDGQERGFGLDLGHPQVMQVASLVSGMRCDSKVLTDELGLEKPRKHPGCCSEHDADRALKGFMKEHPLGPWIQAQRGLAEMRLAARLLGAIGDPYMRPEQIIMEGEKIVDVVPPRPRTVSELWAYCGLKPGQKRRKGERANWSNEAKKQLWLIAGSMLMAGNRDVYDKRKAANEGRIHTEPCVRCGPSGKPAPEGTPWSDGHRHADALRIVGKDVLKGLWRESRRIHEGDR